MKTREWGSVSEWWPKARESGLAPEGSHLRRGGSVDPSRRSEAQVDSRRSFPLSTCATHCSSLIRSSWMGVLLGTGDAQEVEGFFLDVCRPCGDCEGEVGREGGR